MEASLPMVFGETDPKHRDHCFVLDDAKQLPGDFRGKKLRLAKFRGSTALRRYPAAARRAGFETLSIERIGHRRHDVVVSAHVFHPASRDLSIWRDPTLGPL